MDPRLVVLLDKQELLELTARFSRAIDRGDRDLIVSCFHPDALDGHGPNVATAEVFADRVVPIVREYATWHHQLGNQSFEVDGNTAWGETYYYFQSVTRENTLGFNCIGRYIDQFEKRNGVWKFIARTVLLDWRGIPSDVAESGKLEGFVRSQPNDSDLVYDATSSFARLQEAYTVLQDA